MHSVRILKICGLHYAQLINDFYKKKSYLKDLSYLEHKQQLLHHAPVHLNSFSAVMRNKGYECDEVIYDLEFLQKQWAIEKGFNYSSRQWRTDILLSQIEDYRPDVIYLQDIHSMPHFLRKRLKQFFPFVKKVLLYKGFKGEEEECRDIDFVFAGIKPMADAYKKEGIPCELLYHGFDESVLEKIEKNKTEKGMFSFLGYSGYGHMGQHHVSRFYMLRDLAKKTDLKMWLSEDVSLKNPELKQDDQPLQDQFPDKTYEGCFGLDMFNIMQSSNIIFNKHTDMSLGLVGNMRMFETTGVGACLLTDTGENVKDLFEPDTEIVTYKTFDECLEKVNYLINNPKQCHAIANAGHQRTLRDHTLSRRCDVIHNCLQKIL